MVNASFTLERDFFQQKNGVSTVWPETNLTKTHNRISSISLLLLSRGGKYRVYKPFLRHRQDMSRND